MIKKLFLPVFILLASLGYGQVTVAFHENFELPSLSDSLTSTQTAGVDHWNINTRVQTSGLRSDSCQVKTGLTCYLTSTVFSTVGSLSVHLNFRHICKIDLLDIGTVEVSPDGGTTWVQLTAVHYLGTSNYGTNGNRFCASSYNNLWLPLTTGALPLNSWWMQEDFDISSIVADNPNVVFRFRLTDGGTPGPNSNKGWYIDDVEIKVAPDEITPPVITLVTPLVTGTTQVPGPYDVKAVMTDQSGIDTAILVYSVNGAPNDTTYMYFYAGDTAIGQIPALSDGDIVCWSVACFDNSLNHNYTANPVGNCITLHFFGPLPVSYTQNFDNQPVLWEAGPATGSTQWQLGTPNYGTTNSAHSIPNAWDVNLTAPYSSNASCALYSPYFSFTGVGEASLVCWVNYNVQAGNDGTRVEYTINNGLTWSVLGTVNDPLGENWYTHVLPGTGKAAWSGNSSGWKKAKYKLSIFNNQQTPVRFRFIFTSDGSNNQAGISMDDFSIELPAPKDAAMIQIVNPTTQCGLGAETVTVIILNSGSQPISGGLTASYQKYFGGPVVTQAVLGTLMPGTNTTFNFSVPVQMLAVGADSTYHLRAWVTLIGDLNHLNDSAFKTIISHFVPNPPAVVPVTIPYSSSTTITASSPYVISWYNAFTGGQLIGSGPSFTTPVLTSTTVYYPECYAPNGCISLRARDTVYVLPAAPYDGMAVKLTSPVTGNYLTANETVRLMVRNLGTQPLTNFNISYKINNLVPVTELFTSSIPAGDSTIYAFNTTADLHIPGIYKFVSWLSVTGDDIHTNDTAWKQVQCKLNQPCQSAATSVSFTDIGNVTISNLNNGNPQPVLYNSTATKTYSDFTVNAPIILLFQGQPFTISVSQINQFVARSGYCKVFVDWNQDGTFTEATETAFSAGPSSALSMTFSGSLTVPMTAHVGVSRFRVVLQETTVPATVHPCGTYFWGETEDYIADIRPPLTFDAAITAMNQPLDGCTLGLETISIDIKNSGISALSSGLAASYRVGNLPVFSQAVTSPIPAGSTITFPFSQLANMAANQADTTFVIKTWLTLPGDQNPYNDTLKKQVVSKVSPPPPLATSVLIPYATSTVIHAQSADSINWFDAPTGGNMISASDSLAVPVSYYTRIYFAQALRKNGCTSLRQPDTVHVGQSSWPIHLISTSNGQTVSACQGKVFDSGGPGDGYGNNENYMVTVASDDPQHYSVRLFFELFDVKNGDTLYIYDGPATFSPLIGAYTVNSSLAGTSVSAGLANLSGKLTLRFHSGTAVPGAGFEAEVSCFHVCQQIFNALDTALVNPPFLTGGFVNLCKQGNVVLAGKGIYPQNNTAYLQQDTLSVFRWDFGDGSQGTGRITSHHYGVPGTFPVSLTIEDQHGCSSLKSAMLTVRNGDSPVMEINPPLSVCPGQSTVISAGYSDTNTVRLSVPINFFPAGLVSDSALFIPDGTGASGICRESVLEVNLFQAGQVIQQLEDIYAIEMTAEHSFVGDLEIMVTCPNGQSALLKQYIEDGIAYLGSPYGGANHAAFDCYDPPPCALDPLQNPAGTGWPYSWTMVNPQHALMNSYSANPQLDSGSYTPDQSLASLIGCPWNGTWKLKICDYIPEDNGWLFSWRLMPDPEIIPWGHTYVAAIDTLSWSGPVITGIAGTSIQVHPVLEGQYTYTLSITDVLGCTWDTTVTLSAIPSFSVDCGPDKNILPGGSAVLQAVVTGGILPYVFQWSNGALTPGITVMPATTTTYMVTVTDSTGCMDTDTIRVVVLTAVEELNTTEPIQLKVFPNPSTALLNVEVSMPPLSDAVIRIASLPGIVVDSWKVNTGTAARITKVLDVSGLSPGCYLLSAEISVNGTACRRNVLVSVVK